jgi:hypothetical protein
MKQLALTMMVVATLPMMAADALVGEYAANRNELATGLMLHPNQSFEYYFSYGAADYTAKGTWRRDKDAVVLTTSGPEAKPFRVLRTATGTAGTARVFVLGPNGRGAQHIDVNLATAAGPLTARTSEDGMASFRTKGAPRSVSIHVPVYEIDAGPFEIAPGTNDIWLEINGDAITKVRFQDERLRIVNGHLEMTYWKGEKPLLYKKQ